MPPKQEEVVAAQAAPVRLHEPVDGRFDRVPNSDASKVDGLAPGTSQEQHPYPSPLEAGSPAFAAEPPLRADGAALDSLRLAPSGRLASRAALICSGLLRSGSDRLTRLFWRETWRLCFFANLLSIFPSTVWSEPDRQSSTAPQIMASVVNIRDAMEAAFCSAVRVTLAGSITPAVTRSS